MSQSVLGSNCHDRELSTRNIGRSRFREEMYFPDVFKAGERKNAIYHDGEVARLDDADGHRVAGNHLIEAECSKCVWIRIIVIEWTQIRPARCQEQELR
jgi:hypothetical protein